ncbi:MAG: glycosyltransferase [Actinobacteria bacterium]|nr:glycosyltransferase [Actinomycetota bacterium]
MAEFAQDRHIRRICVGRALHGIVVANPIRSFPAGLVAPSLLYVTDDWVAGAPLMGLSGRLVRAVVAANVARASVVAAVSPGLQQSLRALGAESVTLLPNGCRVPDYRTIAPAQAPQGTPGNAISTARTPAGLVGQLNERLDLASLEAVSDAGVPMVVVGPRTDRDEAFGARLAAWLQRDEVTWLGVRPPGELPNLIARMSVGLTPYVDSTFNRASFPLKTLEYLAHGLPVVASDLPAVRWLSCPHIDVATSADDFASLVRRRWLAQAQDEPAARAARQDFARGHGWRKRAEALIMLLADAAGADTARTSV